MRDKHLLGIRPELDLKTEESTEIEAFQNKTLRPILKFQNASTTKLLDQATHFQKMLDKIDGNDPKAFNEILIKYITSNIVFKNKIIGIVIGLMTETELSFYLTHASELNKRIVTMQIQRFSDNKNASSNLNHPYLEQ